MKALVLSDLHFEFHRDGGLSFLDSLPSADIALCPGDISSAHGIEEALSLLANMYRHVIFTFGNHEFYGDTIPNVKRRVHQLAERIVEDEAYGTLHVLDNSTCNIGDQRFVGTTLWFRNDVENHIYANRLSDFSFIKDSESIYDENEKSIEFLNDTLVEGDIVLTHHLPTPLSISPRFAKSEFNRFFLCDVSELIQERKPKLWVHGHTHDSCDYTFGETRVLCNPFGYVRVDENPKFDDQLILEI